MGVNKMQGTPWHVEKYHCNENDERRHKTRCKYYTKDKCLKLSYKCYGSAHCKYYVENVNNNNLKKLAGCKTRKMIPTGSFSVIYLEDNLKVDKIISDKSSEDFIAIDACLTQNVLLNDVGNIFTINGEKIKLINKNILYK